MNPIVQPVPEQATNTSATDEAVSASADPVAVPPTLIDGESQQPMENGEQPQGEESKPAETPAVVDAVDEENAKLAAAEEASATEAPKPEGDTAEKKEEAATDEALKKMEAAEAQATEKSGEKQPTEAPKAVEEKKDDTTVTATPEPVAVAVMDDVTKVENSQPAVAAINSTRLADEIVMLPMPAQAERFPSLRASRV